jgi:hypothetical protein
MFLGLSREHRLSSTEGDEVLAKDTLCVDCIAEKSSIHADEIEPLLARIATKVAITSAVDRCRACGETKNVYVSFRAE